MKILLQAYVISKLDDVRLSFARGDGIKADHISVWTPARVQIASYVATELLVWSELTQIDLMAIIHVVKYQPCHAFGVFSWAIIADKPFTVRREARVTVSGEDSFPKRLEIPLSIGEFQKATI